MDGLGGWRATWCHKAQLERACPESVQPARANNQWPSSLLDLKLKAQDQGTGHVPRHARTRPQGPEAG